MATTDFIAAIELGSSKIAGIAGKKNKQLFTDLPAGIFQVEYG